MKISEIYELFENIGVLTFSTIYKGEVHSRAAHFNGFDEEGIYFRTMWNKPFARQLMETEKVTVFGISDTRILSHDGESGAEFPPGYSIRLIGEVRFLPEDEIRERAKTNKDLELAVFDMDKYPTMRKGNFIINRAKVEIFDFDFECKNRDHKVLRTRMAFGGMTFNEAGPKITEKCIECGKCYKKCSFKAIEKGTPYRVRPERCDDCGDCITVCPVDAIEISSTF